MRPPVISRLEWPDATVALRGDPFGRVFGYAHRVAPGLVRRDASPRVREDLICWRAIQRERKRLGLPPLTDEEMPVG